MSRIVASVPRLTQQCLRQVAASQCIRPLATTPQRFEAKPDRVDISKIKKLQEHFQIDDGTPVFLKGGLRDKFLFGATVLACLYGLGYSTTVIYKLAVPPEN